MSNETQTPRKRGFSVAPSPFNPVKLELGIILILWILVWLILDSITKNNGIQILILFIFGVSAMCWLVLRIRRLLRAQSPHG